MSDRSRGAAALVLALVLAIAPQWPEPAGAQNAAAAAGPAASSVARAARAIAAQAGRGTARGSALRRLYARDSTAPLWSDGARPTPQALQVVAILGDAAARGLDRRDYGVDALAASAAELGRRASADTSLLARFDVALSASVLRFLGDLHEGRANPRTLHFDLPDSHRGLDLASIAAAMRRAADPDSVVRAAEPPYAGYAALKDALRRYRALAADSSLRPPRASRAALRVGAPYADAAALRRLLAALGDLVPTDAAAAAARDGAFVDRYTPELAGAVAAFQRRHGLPADSVLGPATAAQMRVPLATRVRQIELTLERWRWMPDTAPERYAVVNIPGFRLYLFERDPAAARPVLRMNVIVGQAAGRRATPVFTGTLRQVVFRPYWDVPKSIARKELLPAIRRRPGYFEHERLEVVRGGDDDAVVYPPTSANLERVAAGTLRLRQLPGPENSLGLAKFVFPNSYNVYLHGTPATELFAQTRRDFSHGCIRVEDPPALAEHVLRGQDGWDRDSIERTMHGERTVRVSVARPVTVYILYATAVVGADGVVRFHPDLYGHDAVLARRLGVGTR